RHHECLAYRYARAVARLKQLPRLRRVHADRFFAQHVLARLRRAHRPRHMQVVRQRIVNRLDLRVRQHLLVRPVRFRNPQLARRFPGFLPVPRRDAHYLAAVAQLHRRNHPRHCDLGRSQNAPFHFPRSIRILPFPVILHSPRSLRHYRREWQPQLFPNSATNPSPISPSPPTGRPWKPPSKRCAPNSAVNTRCISARSPSPPAISSLPSTRPTPPKSSVSITAPLPGSPIAPSIPLMPPSRSGPPLPPPSASAWPSIPRAFCASASLSSTPGWSTKPAKPGLKPTPTSPKPSISASTTRATCTVSPRRNLSSSSPASTTN